MTLHINRPSSSRYQPRARGPGCRKYVLLGKPTKTKESALLRVVRAMSQYSYKRGDVVLTADYYEPLVVFEIVRHP